MTRIDREQRTVIQVEAEATELNLGEDFVTDIPLCEVFRADFSQIERESCEFVDLTEELGTDGFVGEHD